MKDPNDLLAGREAARLKMRELAGVAAPDRDAPGPDRGGVSVTRTGLAAEARRLPAGVGLYDDRGALLAVVDPTTLVTAGGQPVPFAEVFDRVGGADVEVEGWTDPSRPAAAVRLVGPAADPAPAEDDPE